MERGADRRTGSKMGKIYFKNMDEEWEQFPTDEQIEAARNDPNYDGRIG